jgi:polyphosphate glucokinase
MNVLGIDIGGSAVKGAPVDTRTGRLLAERFRIETPEQLTPATQAKAIGAIAQHFAWRGPVGVGFPGVIHGPRILTSANLHPRFVGCDGVKLFGKATDCPVALVNDADAAGLAEMRLGAGRGVKGSVVMLTFGTGIGSALFIGGKLFPNCELGHMELNGMDSEKYASAHVKAMLNLDWRAWMDRVNVYLDRMQALFWPDLFILGGAISERFADFAPLLRCEAEVRPAHFGNQAGVLGAALAAAEASAGPG